MCSKLIKKTNVIGILYKYISKINCRDHEFSRKTIRISSV